MKKLNPLNSKNMKIINSNINIINNNQCFLFTSISNNKIYNKKSFNNKNTNKNFSQSNNFQHKTLAEILDLKEQHQNSNKQNDNFLSSLISLDNKNSQHVSHNIKYKTLKNYGAIMWGMASFILLRNGYIFGSFVFGIGGILKYIKTNSSLERGLTFLDDSYTKSKKKEINFALE